jgi:hypothetical protein
MICVGFERKKAKSELLMPYALILEGFAVNGEGSVTSLLLKFLLAFFCIGVVLTDGL